MSGQLCQLSCPPGNRLRSDHRNGVFERRVRSSLLSKHEGEHHSYPLVPDGLTIYAIGDIHGRADLLDQTHELIDKDKANSRSERNVEVYLGDYIDRGPDSATVISRLIKRSSQTSTIFLRGNHEQLLLDFLDGKDCWPEWSAVGCITSCLSYGINRNLLFRHVSAKAVRQALAKVCPEGIFASIRTLAHTAVSDPISSSMRDQTRHQA